MAHKAKQNTLQSFAAPSPSCRFTGFKQSEKAVDAPDFSPVFASPLNKFNVAPELFPEGAQPQRAPQSRWFSVKKMAQIYNDVTSEAALRNLIWQAEAWEKFPKAGLKSNG
ncbi:hypothetical protein, partial [Herminiimonas sp. CN]|uniref:hypothetical protein n=1 Tax=Herminiimonas sp. CN TaxID=1349818 RepID=UPI0012DF8335